jgi:hypothetical protein
MTVREILSVSDPTQHLPRLHRKSTKDKNRGPTSSFAHLCFTRAWSQHIVMEITTETHLISPAGTRPPRLASAGLSSTPWVMPPVHGRWIMNDINASAAATLATPRDPETLDNAPGC